MRSPVSAAPAAIPAAMKPSMISPYSKRADPVMMSLAVSSSSALVISAPGTIMAIGAHTANNGTCVSPAPWASAPTNVVAVSVATKGTIATAPWIRLSTVVITPTSAPTTAVTTMAHQELEQDGQTAGQQGTADDPL